MARTYSEVLAQITPYITLERATIWDAETDKFLWIEWNMFPLIDLGNSTNSAFGELVAEYIEDEFERLLPFYGRSTDLDAAGLNYQ